MEILREGSRGDLARKFQCTGCGSLVLAKRSEGRFEADWRDGDALVFDCPSCSKANWIAVSVWDGGSMHQVIGER